MNVELTLGDVGKGYKFPFCPNIFPCLDSVAPLAKESGMYFCVPLVHGSTLPS
jgi:hypothetical protein